MISRKVSLACLLALSSLAAAFSTQAQTMLGGGSPSTVGPGSTGHETGWQGLAKVLDKLSPSVNTAPPPTPSQITDHIQTLLNQGRAQEALTLIEAREKATVRGQPPGTRDVQLEFLHGRALAQLSRTNDAIKIYRSMTINYPELPEPWNNLGILLARQHRLSDAASAFESAVRADPHYQTAQSNLTAVQQLIAQASPKQGSPEAGTMAQ